jgi:hypothetical protein
MRRFATVKFATAGTMVLMLVAGSAAAQPVAYNWEGMGVGVVGSSKCATYKMRIDVTVEGTHVKGSFQQDNRPERIFAAIADADGTYKTKTSLEEGTLDVTGSIKDASPTIVLDGYCKFGGKLTKK